LTQKAPAPVYHHRSGQRDKNEQIDTKTPAAVTAHHGGQKENQRMQTLILGLIIAAILLIAIAEKVSDLPEQFVEAFLSEFAFRRVIRQWGWFVALVLVVYATAVLVLACKAWQVYSNPIGRLGAVLAGFGSLCLLVGANGIARTANHQG